MSDSKKILYKRDTADVALLSLAKQLYGLELYDSCFIDKVVDVVIFGSYARGSERVHDLDVYVEFDECHDMKIIKEYYESYKGPSSDVVAQLYFHADQVAKYLKNGKRIISIYTNASADGSPEHRAIALSDTHYFIMKDGQVQPDEISKLLKLGQ